MKDKVLHIRVNGELKLEAEEILNSLGISLSTGINMFLKRVCIEKGIPFKLGYDDYNKETKNAINESFHIDKTQKRYNNVDELFDDSKKW